MEYRRVLITLFSVNPRCSVFALLFAALAGGGGGTVLLIIAGAAFILIGVILGHISRSRIHRQAARLTGSGIALTGLIIGSATAAG